MFKENGDPSQSSWTTALFPSSSQRERRTVKAMTCTVRILPRTEDHPLFLPIVSSVSLLWLLVILSLYSIGGCVGSRSREDNLGIDDWSTSLKQTSDLGNGWVYALGNLRYEEIYLVQTTKICVGKYTVVPARFTLSNFKICSVFFKKHFLILYY